MILQYNLIETCIYNKFTINLVFFYNKIIKIQNNLTIFLVK